MDFFTFSGITGKYGQTCGVSLTKMIFGVVTDHDFHNALKFHKILFSIVRIKGIKIDLLTL